jgi:hypothetical protein
MKRQRIDPVIVLAYAAAGVALGAFWYGVIRLVWAWVS